MMSGATSDVPMVLTAGTLTIGEWLVDPALGRVSRDGASRHLEPKIMEVLLRLARQPGEVVTKSELLSAVWADTFVSEHVLTHAVWQLRRVFENPRIIQTVARRGYRLTEVVRARTRRICALAVLPFLNLSGEPEQEYFSDGMTEALITGLAQVGGLRLISRTSSMQYKATSKTTRQIAAELKVDGVVEGSITRAGERVRIAVQLIDGVTDAHLWAKSYDTSFGDVLDVQAEMARAITGEIQVAIEPAGVRSPAHVPRPQAHEAYLKGRFCFHRSSPESLRTSIACMEEAIELDRQYALAYAGFADAYALLASPVAEALPPHMANARMRPAVLRALELDPDLPDAHALLGWMSVYYEWDWAGAEKSYARALELRPNFAEAYAGLGTVYDALAEREKALAAWQKACGLDPVSLLHNTLLGWTRVLAGNCEAAVEHLEKTLRLDANYWFAHEVLALAYLGMARREEAVKHGEWAVRLVPDIFPRGVLGHIYGRVGQIKPAQAILTELERLSVDSFVSPGLRAFVAAGHGNVARAFELLEQAYDARDPVMIWALSFERLWKTGMRGDSRFEELLHRMHLPA